MVDHLFDPKKPQECLFQSINNVEDLEDSKVIIVGDVLIHLKVWINFQ